MVAILIIIIIMAVIGLYLSQETAITNSHNQNHKPKETRLTPVPTSHPNIGRTELNVGNILSIILNQIIISTIPNILNIQVIDILAFSASDIICSGDTFPLDTMDITLPTFV
jgi:hypothetical protein